jgi:hypothetical protein
VSLQRVLVVKIVVTAVFWCIPLLLGPREVFSWIGVPFPEPEVFTRLLGAAYASLLVSYVHGLQEVRAGGTARVAVRTGVVSNGIASLILLCFGLAGSWADWGPLARGYMWLSLLATSGITAGLLLAGRSTRPTSPAARARRSSPPPLP